MMRTLDESATLARFARHGRRGCCARLPRSSAEGEHPLAPALCLTVQDYLSLPAMRRPRVHERLLISNKFGLVNVYSFLGYGMGRDLRRTGRQSRRFDPRDRRPAPVVLWSKARLRL